MNRDATLLHLGAQAEMVSGIQHLKAKGYRVFAADPYPNPPGFAWVDGYAAIDITDVPAVTRYAEQIGAQAILAVNEYGVLAASEASHRLGLLQVSRRAAGRSRDKGLMREAWQKAQLPQPKFQIASNEKEIESATTLVGYPLILKPATNCGSRGVSRVTKPKDLSWAIRFAKAYARNARFLVESFIAGTELTVEGLVRNGEVRILAVSDKEHFAHPHYRVAESIHFPAQIDTETLEEVHKIVPAAAAALGIREGSIHCECIVNSAGVFLIEMGARPGGARIFGTLVELTSGICMPDALAQVLLGNDLPRERLARNPVCCKFFSLPKEKQPKDDLQCGKLPGVHSLHFRPCPGQSDDGIATDVHRPGQVIAVGATREIATQNADAAIAAILGT